MNYALVGIAIASALSHLVSPSFGEPSAPPLGLQAPPAVTLAAEAPRITVRSAPRRRAGATAQTLQPQATGNTSLLFYRAARPRVLIGTLSNGDYSGKPSFNLPAGFTHLAVSRGSAVFYSNRTGKVIFGAVRDGAFRIRGEFTWADSRYDIVAASCDSLLFYDFQSQGGVIGTLTRGVFVATGTFTAQPVEQITTSCDSVLFYNDKGGAALATFENGGIGAVTPKSLSAGWDIIVATADSVLFYDGATRTGAWGTLIDGVFTQTGSSGGFSYWSHIAGTADSLLFYDKDSGAAARVRLSGGAYSNAGSSGFFSDFLLMAGGR